MRTAKAISLANHEIVTLAVYLHLHIGLKRCFPVLS
jgi:hypothetical protein